MYCFFIIVMLYLFLPPSLTKTNSMHVRVNILGIKFYSDSEMLPYENKSGGITMVHVKKKKNVTIYKK